MNLLRRSIAVALVCAALLAVPPVVLYAAITVTTKFTAGSTSNAADYDTFGSDFGGASALLSFTSGVLVIACVTSVDDITPEVPVLTQTGQTWTQITGANFLYGPTSLRRWTAFYTIGAGAAASNVRIDHVFPHTGATLHIVELPGADTSSPFIQTAVTTATNGIADGGTFTSTALAAPTADSIVMFCAGVNQDRTWGIESGWTGLFLTSVTSPIIETDMIYRINGSDTTPSTTLSGGSTDAGSIAFEIAQAGGGGGGATPCVGGGGLIRPGCPGVQ